MFLLSLITINNWTYSAPFLLLQLKLTVLITPCYLFDLLKPADDSQQKNVKTFFKFYIKFSRNFIKNLFVKICPIGDRQSAVLHNDWRSFSFGPKWKSCTHTHTHTHTHKIPSHITTAQNDFYVICYLT